MSGEIVAHDLTEDSVSDPDRAAPLVAAVAATVGTVIADGAYDGEPIYDAIRTSRPGETALLSMWSDSLARVSQRGGGGTGQIGRQTRRSAQRDACPSGKRFDAGCRPICPALRVAPGGPSASSRTSTVGACYAFRPSPSGSTPPGAMTPLPL